VPCVAPNLILRVVLDTCILKLATFPAQNNASALVFELARRGLIEAWVSPAILEEYADVLGDVRISLPKSSRAVGYVIRSPSCGSIRHEPDNRFLECAFAAAADYLITINTARGHFDQNFYQTVRVVTPGELLNLDSVARLVLRFVKD
jgi:predicted nucleic acid-binding protein